METTKVDTNQEVVNKPWYKKWGVWALIFVALLLHGIDLENQALRNLTVGDTANVGDREITLLDVATRSVDTPDKVNTHQFVIVKLRIKNISKKSIKYNVYDYQIKDQDGVLSKYSGRGYSDGIESGSLAPGGHITGTVVFESLLDNENLGLVVDNRMNKDYIEFKLY